VWKKRRFAEAIPFGLALALATLLTGAIAAGAVRTPPPAKPAAEAPEKRSGPFAELKYRFIGPPGNRVSAVVGVPGDANTYYAGGASGGAGAMPRAAASLSNREGLASASGGFTFLITYGPCAASWPLPFPQAVTAFRWQGCA